MSGYGYGYQSDPTAPLGGAAYSDPNSYGAQYPQYGTQGFVQPQQQQGFAQQGAGYGQQAQQYAQAGQDGYSQQQSSFPAAQAGYGAQGTAAQQQQYGSAQSQYAGAQQYGAQQGGYNPQAGSQQAGYSQQAALQHQSSFHGAPVAQAQAQSPTLQQFPPPQAVPQPAPQQVPPQQAPPQAKPPAPVAQPYPTQPQPALVKQPSTYPTQTHPPLQQQPSSYPVQQPAAAPATSKPPALASTPSAGKLAVNPSAAKLNVGAFANPGSKPPATVLSAQTAGGATHSYTVEERRSFAEHLNQVLGGDAHLKDRLPMNPQDDSLFHVVADGVLLCKFINKVKPGAIPEHKIVTKNPKTPFDINANHVLAIEAAKQLGCSLVNIGPGDLSAGPKAAHLILGLLWQLIRMDLLNQVSLAKHPEMVALMAPTEDLQTFAFVAPEQNLLRWFNYHLKRAGSPRQVANFSGDIKDSECYTILLNQLMPNVCTLDALRETDPLKRAEVMLQNADAIGCRKFVNASDVVMGHPKLNLAFVAYLFNQHPGLEIREREDMDLKLKRDREIQDALAVKERAEADARAAMQAAEAAKADEEKRRLAWLAEEDQRRRKWEADEAARKAKWEAEEAARLAQLQELDRRKAQLDAELARQREVEKQQHDARLAADTEARRRALEAEEYARRQQLIQEEEARKAQWLRDEAARQAARAEEDRRRAMEEEARRQAAAFAEAERQRLENERKQAEDAAAWQRQQLMLQQQREAQLAMEQAAAAAALAQQQQLLAQQQQQEAYQQQQEAYQQQLLLQQQQQQQMTTTYYQQQQQPQQYTTTTTYQYVQQPPPLMAVTQQTIWTAGFPIPRLFVTAVEARNLVKKELLGLLSSDPYCVVELHGMRFQTPHQKSTRNPCWQQSFEFRNVQATDELVFSIWDYDHLGKHDFMGEVRCTYVDLQQPGERWLPLRSRSGHHDRVAGEIHVRLIPSA